MRNIKRTQKTDQRHNGTITKPNAKQGARLHYIPDLRLSIVVPEDITDGELIDRVRRFRNRYEKDRNKIHMKYPS